MADRRGRRSLRGREILSVIVILRSAVGDVGANIVRRKNLPLGEGGTAKAVTDEGNRYAAQNEGESPRASQARPTPL